VDTNDRRSFGRPEVDALLRRLLALDVDPAKARIHEEIVRRRLAAI
jgi:hypothetical protein